MAAASSTRFGPGHDHPARDQAAAGGAGHGVSMHRVGTKLPTLETARLALAASAAAHLSMGPAAFGSDRIHGPLAGPALERPTSAMSGQPRGLASAEVCA